MSGVLCVQAKALPPILYLAALVVSLRRAAANILGEGNATAASVNAAAGASAAVGVCAPCYDAC